MFPKNESVPELNVLVYVFLWTTWLYVTISCFVHVLYL